MVYSTACNVVWWDMSRIAKIVQDHLTGGQYAKTRN